MTQVTNPNLDQFFAKTANSPIKNPLTGQPQAPPPPPGVDVRQFHQHTAGGFGNMPMTSDNNMGSGGGESSTNPLDQLNPIFAKMQEFAATNFSNFTNTDKLSNNGPNNAMGSNLNLIRDTYSSYLSNSNIRPWKEFALPISKPNDVGEAMSFLSRNLSYFTSNYMLLFVVYFISNVMMAPFSLTLIIALAFIWFAFLRKNEDPDWQINIGGVSVGQSQRWIGMSVISGVLVLLVCGSLIFSTVLYFSFFAVLHGIVHQPPMLISEVNEPNWGGKGGSQVPANAV